MSGASPRPSSNFRVQEEPLSVVAKHSSMKLKAAKKKRSGEFEHMLIMCSTLQTFRLFAVCIGDVKNANCKRYKMRANCGHEREECLLDQIRRYQYLRKRKRSLHRNDEDK